MKLTKAFSSVFAFSVIASFASNLTFADDIYRIQVGKDYDHYSNQELKQRVWQLERAVEQLQARVFQLEVKPAHLHPVVQPWTCRIQSFGKTHISTADTRASALAQVLKACGDASHAIHCREAEAKCSNE